MNSAPKGLRLHLGLFGRRNVGKSSLLNMMTRRQSAIVSALPGTTTDPVEKPMELLPLGPVLFIDTAGVDDSGVLGEMRIEKTRQVFDRTEIGLVVVDEAGWGTFENSIARELQARNIPLIAVLNKADRWKPDPSLLESLKEKRIPYVAISALQGAGREELLETLVRLLPDEFLSPPPILSDLIPPGELAILVVPIDKEAPKGRLILPQVQTIRDLLDGDQSALVLKVGRLKETLARLSRPPAIVVTDSQAFAEVAELVPPEIMLTSFSVLFARQKGDLATMIDGAKTIRRLTPADRVLIAESCTHHPIVDDIGTGKIPRKLRQIVGEGLTIAHVHGHDFPVETLGEWDLVIHCGACMWNRREMLSRMMHCVRFGVPITNYGLALAEMTGILDRAVKPFRQEKREAPE